MTFIQEIAHLILLYGCSLVEDFNNFRLCGSNSQNTSSLAWSRRTEPQAAQRMKPSACGRLWCDCNVWLKNETGNAQPGACVDVLPRCCMRDMWVVQWYCIFWGVSWEVWSNRLAGHLIFRDGAISLNWPQIASNRTIWGKSQNL